MISVICEQFGCLPSEALRELEVTPYGLIWSILDLRAYKGAYDEVQRARKQEHYELEVTPYTDLVTEHELLAEQDEIREWAAKRRLEK